MKIPGLQKAIAGCVALTYFCTQCAFGELSQTSLWEERRASQEKSAPALLASLPFALPAISAASPSRERPLPARIARLSQALSKPLSAMPNDRVTLSETREGGARPPVIILQDIHLHPEAQANLEAAVASLLASGLVGSLHLEGAFGKLDLTRFRAFSSETRKSLTAAMVAGNGLGGPSAAAVLAAHAPDVHGADNERAYRANVAAIQSSAPLRAAALDRLERERRDVNARKEKIFGAALKKLDRLVQSHRTGGMSFGAYVSALSELGLERQADVATFLSAYPLATSIDFSRVEAERRAVLGRITSTLTETEVRALMDAGLAFRAGRLGFADFYRDLERLCLRHRVPLDAYPAFRNYLRYVLLSDQIDATRLLAWLDTAEARLSDSLSTGEPERALAREDRALGLASRLVRFELTPAEWARWPRELSHLPNGEAARLESFESFYREADARTASLAASAMAGADRRARILVIGGFHTPALIALLRKKGVPYAVASPRVTRADASPTAYLDVFTREKTPLEKIFAGEKLTINPAATVLGGSNAESVASGVEFLSRAAALDTRSGLPIAKDAGVSVETFADGVIRTSVDGRNVDVAFDLPPGYRAVDPAPVAGTRVVEKDDWVTPGAWATAWQGSINLLSKYLGEKNALKLRPLVAGIGEGAIAGTIAVLFPFSITALLGWVTLMIAFHYYYGVYWWNPDQNQWDVVHYFRRAEPGEVARDYEIKVGPYILRDLDRYYFRANMVAATTTLGFFASAAGVGITLTYIAAIVPHVIFSFTRERRVNEERRRATEEKKRQFDEAIKIIQIAESLAPPTPAELELLVDTLKTRNDLASFVRFNDEGTGRYRLAMIMQPGSTGGGEGPGFKNFNDAVGYSLMNVVFANRNSVTWRIAEKVFADLGARAGRPVVHLIGSNSKSLRFALDMDALEQIYPDAAELERALNERMDQVTRESSEALKVLLTVANEGSTRVANKEIVTAVRIAQAKGKLPKKITVVPLYWGLSTEAKRGNLDDSLVRDAQATAAINTVRAMPRDQRGLGRSFTLAELRANLLTIDELNRELTSRGVLVPTPTAAGTLNLAPRPLIEAIRKKKDKAMIKVLAKLLHKRAWRDRGELADTLKLLKKYISVLTTFDSIKPWVGTRERPEAEDVARDVNESIAALDAMLDPRANRQSDWTALRPQLDRALSRDPRMPFLGSQFDFYGRSVPLAPRQETAALFVDFRGFGALIFNELESTAARLTAVARAADDATLERKFSKESLVLGDKGLDPFADALRNIRTYFEDTFGAGAVLRFYFGGDDVTVVLPQNLVYEGQPGAPRQELLENIFARIPPGMRVRVVAATSARYLKKDDPVLAVALALQDADELANVAKTAEDSWKPRKTPVEEVAVHADPLTGAYHRAPVFNRVPARAELVFPGHDDTATTVVKMLMQIYRRLVNRNADEVTARAWAEAKAEESLILLAAGVAFGELILLPGMSLLLNNYIGPLGAIVVGAFIMVLFHELTVMMAWAKRLLFRYILRRPITRPDPPGPWTDWIGVRMSVRFAASLLILSIAFFPLYSVMTPDHMLLFSSFQEFFPTLTSAFLMHMLWNIYVPPAWRLSLLKMPAGGATKANPNHPRENQDTPLAFDIPHLAVSVRGVIDGHGGLGIGRVSSRWAARGARSRMTLDARSVSGPAVFTVNDRLMLMRNGMLMATVASLQRSMTAASAGSVAMIFGRELWIAQAGDAGTYLYTENASGIRKLTKVTIDNLDENNVPAGNIIEDLQGPWAALIDRDLPLAPALAAIEAEQRATQNFDSYLMKTPEQIAAFHHRNIVRNSIGESAFFPIIFRVALPTGGKTWVLQLTDGIIDNLSPAEIETIVASAATPQEASDQLVAAAVKRMRSVDRARKPLETIFRYYDTLGFLAPGNEENNRLIRQGFTNPALRAPAFRPTASSIVTRYYGAVRDLNNWGTTPEVDEALSQLEAIASEPYFVLAKPDDALALTTDANAPLVSPTMASIIDRWLVRRLGADHWFYALYSTVLVHWELVFFLPVIASVALDGGLVLAPVTVLVSSALFARTHPGRTADERWAILRTGLLISVALVAGSLAFDSLWMGAAAGAIAHGIGNYFSLRALRKEARGLEALRAYGGGSLVDLIDSLPLNLGVANLDANQNAFARASTTVHGKLGEWERRGLIDADESRKEWNDFSEKLRRRATGRAEDGLTLQSQDALALTLRREADAASELVQDTVIVRFIDATAGNGLNDARQAMAGRGRERVALVVKGDASAIENEFGSSTPVLPWSPDLKMTGIQSAVADRVSTLEGSSAPAVREAFARAAYRLIVPNGFDLPPGFMEGINDLERYKVYVLIRNALLAVEIRPDRLEDAAEIARLVGRQA